MIFKLSPSKRKNTKLDEPKSLKTWIINLISEVFGTAILSFLFAGLFIILPNGHIVLDYLYSGIFIAIYSGFVVIGILFIFFIRWSADANPIISIYKTIIGVETYRYCGAKIIAQIVGSILAGLVVWGLTQSAIGTAWNIFLTSTPKIQHGFFEPHRFSKIGGFLFPFAIEIIVGLILLWAIFSTSFKDKYRLLIVLGMTMFATLIGSSAQIMNFNAVRALSQDVGAIFTNQMNGDMWITLAGIIVGTLLTPFILVFLQWFIGDYFNPFVRKVMLFKNTNNPQVSKVHQTPKKQSLRKNKNIKNKN